MKVGSERKFATSDTFAKVRQSPVGSRSVVIIGDSARRDPPKIGKTTRIQSFRTKSLSFLLLLLILHFPLFGPQMNRMNKSVGIRNRNSAFRRRHLANMAWAFAKVQRHDGPAFYLGLATLQFCHDLVLFQGKTRNS